MAFSTIQGSGGAPDSFVGTSGVDTISLINSSGDFVLTALAEDDDVQFLSSTSAPAVVDATLKGGEGDDFFGGAGLFSNVFINGNADDDLLSFLENGTFAGSSLLGGKGDDTIVVNTLNQSLINGNIDNDEIGFFNSTSSSIFGGQGADAITIGNAAPGGGSTGELLDSVVNGDKGNDQITINTSFFSESTVYGGDGEDTITAAAATDDGVVISGDAGNDTLTGSVEADTILGGDGNDLITGGEDADTLTGGDGSNRFAYAATDFGASPAAATATVVAGTLDTITDFKNTGVSTTTDYISGVFSTANNAFTNAASVAAKGYATYALALTAAEVSADGSAFLAAVGSGASWTAYLFQNTTALSASDVTAGVQLGTTGQFGTAALANAAIDVAQIV